MGLRLITFIAVGGLFLSLSAFSQNVVHEGVTMGNFVLRPQASVLGAYDSRVRLSENAGDSGADVYGEISAGIALKNLPALYSLSADASYGRRYYQEYTHNNDDFYNAGASVGSDGEALRWGLSGDVSRTLGYDSSYDPETGDGPDSILSNEPSRRWIARGNVGYAIPFSQKTSLVAGYDVQHYYEQFENDDSAEWQTHAINLVINHELSERISLLAGGYYTLQVNDDEEGYIIAVGAGAQGRFSDKTSWSVLGGVGHADYDLSGSDQSGLLDLNAQWQATEKISTYVFYGNAYEPGYGGGKARMVYRGGYGAGWQLASRWLLGGQVLHDYTQEVGSGTSSDEYGVVKHFFSTQLTYNPTRHLSAMLRYQYVNDEEPEDQQIISLSVSYIF